jgi:hypothetical protein
MLVDDMARALADLTNDLAAELEAKYRHPLKYPAEKRRYERDMKPVIEARHLLDVYRYRSMVP